MSSTKPRLSSKTLAQYSCVDDEGVGEKRQYWDVMVNDDFLSVTRLQKLGPLDGVTARFADDDGAPAGGTRWSRTPPGYQWLQSIRVEAPLGTRFRRRISRPDFAALHEDWTHGTPRSVEETIFVLSADERLTEDHAFARDQRRRTTPPPAARMTPGELARGVGSLLRSLESPVSATQMMDGEIDFDEFDTCDADVDDPKRDAEVDLPQRRSA